MAQKIIVGMSGGVDSSVAAYLLREQGYDVIGVFMQNWQEQDEQGICSAYDDYTDVRLVCQKLDIPYYTVNFSKQYWDRVFTYFLQEYKAGRTPNPDVLCNREIKFDAFLNFALQTGADAIATGHYADVELRRGSHRLLRAADSNKDQTYFLHRIQGSALAKVHFPLGKIQKEEVRKIAAHLGLSTAAKKDSTGVCFIGERNFKRFLQEYLPAQPGEIVTTDGTVVGRHDGLMYYTLGQRRGLGIGDQGFGERWFVVDKDLHKNRLVVHRGEHTRKLFSLALEGEDLYFLDGSQPNEAFACAVKTRYRQPDQQAVVYPGENNGCRIEFEQPQRAVTPGQYAVIYKGDECLGGCVIKKAYTME